MFIQNKYYYQYLRIIFNAGDRRRIPYEHESHHIMPKSIWPEYVNEDWNKVLLTHKEHYVCHHLLTKCLPCADMTRAYWFMTHNKGMPITAKVYENLRREFGKTVSETHTGKIVSEETKRKLSEINIGKGDMLTEKGRQSIINAGKKRTGKLNHRYGTKASKSTRKKMSESRKGEKHPAVKGYYITPYGKFLTAGEVAEAAPVHINVTSIRNWCKKNPDKVITKQTYNQSPYLTDSFDSAIIGKTFREIGFGYETF